MNPMRQLVSEMGVAELPVISFGDQRRHARTIRRRVQKPEVDSFRG